MWNNTRATEILRIKYPVIQGPFGGRFSSAELTATVSNCGGMGSFGLNAYSADEILDINKSIRTLTNQPYALNLWVPLQNDPVKQYPHEDFEKLIETVRPYFDELGVTAPQYPQYEERKFEDQMEAIFKAGPPVMSFIFGVPSRELILELKKNKTTVIITATTPEEALQGEEAGADLVVASGAEAGGHRASFLKPAKEELLMDTLSLVEKTVKAIKIPVIAAGGISDGDAIYKMMKVGASAVQIGTAFLATDESNASDVHKKKLLSAEPIRTSLTKAYSGRLARAVSNDFIEKLKDVPDNIIAPYPIQGKLLAPLMQAAIARQKWEYVAFWAGQPSSELVHTSAEKLFHSMVERLTHLQG